MDKLQEAQVWQRVMASPKPWNTGDLRQLYAAAADRAAIYRSLAGSHPGKERLKKLYEEELADLACLRGICALSGDTVKFQIPKSGRETGGKALEQCYHRARRAAAEYTARIADPEFGVVFEELAKRQRERCLDILRILGAMALPKARNASDPYAESKM